MRSGSGDQARVALDAAKRWNRKYFRWWLGIYAAVAVHRMFPALYGLYTFENLTILVLLQAFLLASDYGAVLSRTRKEYFRYLALYFEWLLVIFVGVLFFWFTYVSRDEIPNLSRFSGLAFFLSAYLSIYYSEKPLPFFRKIRKMTRPLAAFSVLMAFFVGIYCYRFAFQDLEPSYQSVLSVVAGSVFFAGIRAFVVRAPSDGDLLATGASAFRFTFPSKSVQFAWPAALSLFVLLGIPLYWWQSVENDQLAKYEGNDGELRVSFVDETAGSGDSSDGLGIGRPIDLNPAQSQVAGSGVEGSGAAASSGSTLASSGVVLTGSGAALASSGTVGSGSAMARERKIGDLFAPKRFIWFGDSGKDVAWVQSYLKRAGYYSGPLTATFDEATGNALARFIRAKTGKSNYTQLGPKAMGTFRGIAVR